ncbi:hypothetical protein Bbelb_271100 [Branchiostoma belcheri]|nr:hypothetical protein Bbelb_271100 [Branchiostoma belcheri]
MTNHSAVKIVDTFGTVRVTKAFLPLIRREKGRVVNISSVNGLYPSPMAGAYSMAKAAVEFFSDALRHEMHKWGVKVVIVEPASFARATDMFLPAVFNKFVEVRSLRKPKVKFNTGLLVADFGTAAEIPGKQMCGVAGKTDVRGGGSACPDLRNSVEDVVMEDYGKEYFDFKMEQLRSYANSDKVATDPAPVIDVMVDAVTLITPKHRYLVGASFENYVTWMWLGYFPSKWTGSTLVLEGGPKLAMLQKTD